MRPPSTIIVQWGVEKHMLKRMHYFLDPPSKINPNISVIAVRDDAGGVLGSIIRKEPKEGMSVDEARYLFEDSDGNRVGGILAGRADRPNTYDIIGPLRELRGRLAGVPVNVTGAPIKMGAITLQDISGKTIAISEAFEPGLEGKFEHIRKKGLKIKTMNGSTLAVLKKAMSSDRLQIDLHSSTADRLAILALITVVVL